MTDYRQRLTSLLELAVDAEASDLHLSAGHPPVLRVANRLMPVPNREPLSSEETEGLATALMGEDRRQQFVQEKSIDFSYALREEARFRVNVFYQRERVSVALRYIPADIPALEALNLPDTLRQFIRQSQGFVLVTGPSGHGKSTTLASLLDEINHTESRHIITIEDPVEYVFDDNKSIIDQREVFRDATSFEDALRATFRQDPDVIMVGEMRDKDTIATALTAAETGHLVFATLHTNSASQTIHRIVDTFPPEQQGQVRAQLSGSLLGVLSQRLLPDTGGGLIPAYEIMMNNAATANLIRENKIHEIPMVIETSAGEGMISLNRRLVQLVEDEEVEADVALTYSNTPNELRDMLARS